MYYFEPAQPGQRVRAVPATGRHVDFWILGSSLYGAQLAAALGLPYAFASHFAPALLHEAIHVYRARFKPSKWLAQPHVMLGVNVFAAEREREARTLMSSLLKAWISLRHGEPRQLSPPEEGFEERMDPADRAMLQQSLACSFVGDPDQVRAGLQGFIDATQANELIVAAQIYDHAARLRSYELVASVRDSLVLRRA